MCAPDALYPRGRTNVFILKVLHDLGKDTTVGGGVARGRRRVGQVTGQVTRIVTRHTTGLVSPHTSFQRPKGSF